MAKGQGKTRRAYMMEIAAEIVTGERQPHFSSDAMEWGTKTEPQARSMYEFMSGNTVEQIAFAYFEDKKVGCSPDGLIGVDGLVEFKCPNTKTQIETYLSGKAGLLMPSSHMAQVQGQMWVMDRKWCDFVSFDPSINTSASYYVQRIKRDDSYIKELEKACDSFLYDLGDMLNKLL
jgi:hypothetical protein